MTERRSAMPIHGLLVSCTGAWRNIFERSVSKDRNIGEYVGAGLQRTEHSLTTTFKYRAATALGEVVEGELRAESERAALESLRRQTLYPVDLAPDGPAGGGRWRPTLGAARQDARAATVRTLATLLASGMSLDRTLGFGAQHAGHPAVGEALERVRVHVRQGGTLAAAFASEREFGAFAAAVARAGEESGALDEALGRLAEHYERVRDLSAQVRTALLYPALMGIVATVGVIVLLAFVVPRFNQMLGDAGGVFPLSTRILIGASGAFTGWWWVWLPLTVLLVVGWREWLRVPANKLWFHRVRLGWPVVGALEVGTAGARFARAFGVLLQSGSGVLAAMRTAKDAVSNLAIAGRLETAIQDVSRGEQVAQALAPALPPLAVQLLATGEESGRLDEMSLRVADTLEGDVQRTLKTLVGLIEPVMIVLFGGVVGFIALAMLQAVYSINANVL